MYEMVQKTGKDDFEYRLYHAKGGVTKTLTVVLHGQGSSLDKWHNRCIQIRDAIPNTAVIAIQAPMKGEIRGLPAYRWLDCEGVPGKIKNFSKHIFGGVSIIKKVSNFIDKKSEELGIRKENMALVGHSMGGIIALQVAFNSKAAYGAVFGMGTALMPFTKVNSKPDLFLTMGSEDKVFGPKSIVAKKGLSGVFNKLGRKFFGLQESNTIKRLGKYNIAYEYKTYEGKGHSVSDDVLNEGISFISERLRYKKLLNNFKSLTR